MERDTDLSRWWHIAVVTVALAGCGEQQMGDRVIAQNDEFCVTGDSVITGDVTVWAVSPLEISNELNLSQAERMLQRLSGTDSVPYCLTSGAEATRLVTTDDYPRYQSQQTLVDALYNLSVNEIAANQSQNGGFNSHHDHSTLYGSIYLSLALLEPYRAMTTLSLQVSDGVVMQSEGTWPVCDDRLGWPIAAWEVYCATGDKQWLSEAYDVTVSTIDEELTVQGDRQTGLLRGGLLSRYHAGDFYPEWATATDVSQTQTMLNNVLAVRAMEMANEMAEELDVEPPYPTEATHLREAINRRLWDESAGRYSACLMGRVVPTRSPLTDNLAQALAVMWDLADDDRSVTLIESTPMGHRGILPTYPAPWVVEPYLEFTAWSQVQACWNLAAAAVDNRHALRRGMAALYRALALYQPHHLGIEGSAPNNLASAAATVAMVTRVMAGMRLTADGIEFAPMVPECFPGNKNILNLTYRDAVLDITLVGTGNDIDAMTLDGQTVESGYIPGDITGHHIVVIKLKQGRAGSQRVTLAGEARLPQSPEVTWNADSGRVDARTSMLGLKLAINGVRSYSVSDSVFKIPPMGELAELWLVSANRYGYSLPSQGHLVPSGTPIDVAVTDTLLKADTLQVKARTNHAGRYLLMAQYSIDDGCDVMLIEANGHHQGTIVLPSTGVTGSQTSTAIWVQLLRSDNVLTLRRYRLGFRASISRLTLLQQQAEP